MKKSTEYILSGFGCGVLAMVVATVTEACVAREWYLVTSICLVAMGGGFVLLGRMEAEEEAERARRWAYRRRVRMEELEYLQKGGRDDDAAF